MNILKFPHEDLRVKVDLFDFETAKIDPVKLEKDMIELMLCLLYTSPSPRDS